MNIPVAGFRSVMKCSRRRYSETWHFQFGWCLSFSEHKICLRGFVVNFQDVALSAFYACNQQAETKWSLLPICLTFAEIWIRNVDLWSRGFIIEHLSGIRFEAFAMFSTSSSLVAICCSMWLKSLYMWLACVMFQCVNESFHVLITKPLTAYTALLWHQKASQLSQVDF